MAATDFHSKGGEVQGDVWELTEQREYWLSRYKDMDAIRQLRAVTRETIERIEERKREEEEQATFIPPDASGPRPV